MTDFVHSWNLEAFKRSPKDLEVIMANLQRLGFSVKGSPPPDDDVCRIDEILESIKNLQLRDRVPWLFIVSNKPSFLRLCTTVLPVSFALSTARPVYVIAIDDLCSLFSVRPPLTDFDYDEAGNSLREIYRTGFLVLKSLDEKSQSAPKFASKFTNLLSYRSENNMPTLFTAVYDGDLSGEHLWKHLSKRVSGNIGDSATVVIREFATLFHYRGQDSGVSYVAKK